MGSLQVIFGCAWLPTLIVLIVVGYFWWKHLKYTPNNSRMPDIFNIDGDYITDGFGSYWWAFCQKCNKRSMVVVRPGKVECEHGCKQSAKNDRQTRETEDNRT